LLGDAAEHFAFERSREEHCERGDVAHGRGSKEFCAIDDGPLYSIDGVNGFFEGPTFDRILVPDVPGKNASAGRQLDVINGCRKLPHGDTMEGNGLFFDALKHLFGREKTEIILLWLCGFH
jgi:hypothetical protein